jgi:cystathionine beta-lyase family protein involved in aluminum resistance
MNNLAEFIDSLGIESIKNDRKTLGGMEIDINRYYKVIGIDGQIGYYKKSETIDHKMEIDSFIVNKIITNNGDCFVECYDEFERPQEYKDVGFMDGCIKPHLTDGKITLICC